MLCFYVLRISRYRWLPPTAQRLGAGFELDFVRLVGFSELGGSFRVLRA